MTIPILILFIIIIAVVTGGALWFISHRQHSTQGEKKAKETIKAERIPFRWSYIILPVAILILSILLSAYFYRQLSTEVAYHFKLDGSPDKWMSRNATIVWTLTPQLFLALLAGAITWGVTKLGILAGQTETTWVKPERVLLFMGNIIAMPQLIVSFAMFDIFSYNSYNIHIMPMWIFLLIILGLTTAAVALLLSLIILKAKGQLLSQRNQRTKED